MRGEAMRTRFGAAVFGMVVAALVFPGVSLAAEANAYGQVFAGQAVCMTCHGDVGGRWQVSSYRDTAHGRFVTDVQANPSALEPSVTSPMWPSPAFGTGFSFGPNDLWLQLGAPGKPHEYVSRYRNDGSHTLSTGKTLDAVAGPADDTWLFAVTFETHEGVWEVDAPTSHRSYFQSCAGCHHLGVTRPLNTTYTLGSGATASRSTETSYSGFGIQCEHCHGTGKAATGDSAHWSTGVEIVRTRQALKSETCGQCHVNGTAKERNLAGGTMSSPNGFTPDRDLRDFFDVAGTQYIKTSSTSPVPTIPASDTKFYPSGHNKGMHHSYYNEWMLTGHARSLRYENGELWSSHGNDDCLPCHSGEGFLKSIGYGRSGPNDIGSLPSSVESDVLNIECGVCHAVHASSGEPLGLRLPAEELCGRCHNGELAEGAQMEPGTKPHHPQREMIEGYGLIGVEPTERFMGETECPECHMPMTRETRVSHSFRIMKPGDAQDWGVQKNGDSCTLCHPSRSRTQLQADLDGWRSTLEEEAAAANAEISRAAARAAASTIAGSRLLAAARSNVAFVEADSSGGGHNYPYALKGLERAQDFARAVGATAKLSASAYSGGKAYLTGSLRLGDGLPAAYRVVTIDAKPAGAKAFAPLATVVTGASGSFSLQVAPKVSTSYRMRWSEIDTKTEIKSSSVKVGVPSKTTLSLSTSRVRARKTVTIKGSVSPAHPGAKVKIAYRRGSGSWRKLTTRTLSSTSRYSFTWRPYTKGRYSIRITFEGDASHLKSTSRTLGLTVY